jgi:hypothetical protein
MILQRGEVPGKLNQECGMKLKERVALVKGMDGRWNGVVTVDGVT